MDTAGEESRINWEINTDMNTLRSCVCSGTSGMVNSLGPHGLSPTRLLCPGDSPGKNTRVGCHTLLQGIFLTQGSNPHSLCLLHCRQILYPLSHLGSPIYILPCVKQIGRGKRLCSTESSAWCPVWDGGVGGREGEDMYTYS